MKLFKFFKKIFSILIKKHDSYQTYLKLEYNKAISTQDEQNALSTKSHLLSKLN